MQERFYTLKSDKSTVTESLKRAESKVRESSGIRTASVTDGEATSLSELSDIIGSGMEDEETSKGNVSPNWIPNSTHKEISKAAVNKMSGEVDTSLADDIGEWSNDSDSFDYDFVSPPSLFHDIFPDDPAKAYAHSYNPDFEPQGDNNGEILDPGTPLGNAHVFTHRYMNRAEDRSGNEKWKQLDYAMHIIADLGTPVRTGAWVTGTIANQKVHDRYEQAVESSLNEFMTEVKDLDNLTEVPNSAWWDPDSKYMKHAKNLANRTHDYAFDCVTSATENPDDPLEDCKSQTQDSLNWSGMYAMGLIGELTGYT